MNIVDQIVNNTSIGITIKDDFNIGIHIDGKPIEMTIQNEKIKSIFKNEITSIEFLLDKTKVKTYELGDSDETD